MLSGSAFQNPRQERLHRLLGELLGPGPASAFYDACRLRIEPHQYLTTVHLVGHLFREIESAVLGVVAPKHLHPLRGSDVHKQRIAAAAVILAFQSTVT